MLFSEESGYLDKGKGGREKEGLKKERRPDDLRTEQRGEKKGREEVRRTDVRCTKELRIEN